VKKIWKSVNIWRSYGQYCSALFFLTHSVECSAVMLPRCETRWNYLRCPKLTKRSQPLVGRTKFTILWGHMEEILLLNKFLFWLSIRALIAKTYPDKVVRWCPDGDFWRLFLRPVFSASRAQYVSDLHSKFALRTHHVWNFGRHPTSDCWD